MADKTARILIDVEVNAAEARQAVETLLETFKRLEPELDKMAPGLRAAFKNAATAVKEYEQAVANGTVRGQADLRKLTTAQSVLAQEIKKTGVDVTKLGAESQAAYRRLENAQRDALVTTRQIKADLGDVSTELGANTAGFTGFGNAAQQLGGKIGSLAQNLTLVTGAAAAGWATGQQINAAVKTDMSEFTDFMSIMGAKVKETFSGIATIVIGQINAINAILHWDVAGMNASGLEVIDGMKKVKHAMTGSLEEARKLRDAEKDLIEQQKKDAEESRLLAIEKDKLAVAAKRLGEQQAALKEKLDDVTRSIAAQTAEMMKQRGAASTAGGQGEDASGQLRNAQANAAALDATIAELKAKIASMTLSFGEDSTAVKQATIQLAEYEAQLALVRDRIPELTKQTADYAATRKAAEAADAKAQEEIKKLNQKQSELAIETQKLTGITLTQTTAQSSATRGIADAATGAGTLSIAVENVGTAQDHVASKMVQTKRVLEDGTTVYGYHEEMIRKTDRAGVDANVTLDAANTKQMVAAKAVDATTTAMQNLGLVKLDDIKTEVTTLRDLIDDLATRARGARTEIEKLAKLGDDDTDEGDDGISIKPSSSHGGKLTGGFGNAPGSTR